jgi:general secretion pathway protein D
VIQVWKNRQARGLLAAVVVALSLTGCAASLAYRQGRDQARKGNWDAAVARLTKAVAHSPDNVRYRMALDDASAQAGRQHAETGRQLMAAGELDRAREEFEIANKFDPVNTAIAAALEDARGRIRRREDDARERLDKDAAVARARAGRFPAPELSPRSQKPISLRFNDASLKLVFETLGKVGGVNILFDPDFKDKQVTFSPGNVTFKEALEQLTFVNRFFYKVVDANTLIVIPDTQPKHKTYDDQFVRTFYLRNIDDKEGVTAIGAAIQKILGAGAKQHPDPQLGAITVMGTAGQLAVAEKVIAAHDKPRGEVLVEVRIIEVNRNKMRNYGIELTNYQISDTFDPTGNSLQKDTSGNPVSTQIRAHLLSSLNLSDFVLNIPAGIVAHFLETENTSRLLASPRLRAAEGKKASLSIVSEIPVPTTSFYSYSSGQQGSTDGTTPYAPTTSFQLKSVGLKLEIQPTIGSGDDITLDVKAEFGSEGASRDIGNLKIPTFNTRTIEGQIRVRDGETSLIGGLLQETEQLTLKGILGIQSIPILNRLLSAPTKTRVNTEMLISLTPHIIRAPHVSEDDITPLDAGTQERMRVKSAESPLFAADEPSDAVLKLREARPSPPPPTMPATPTPTPASTPTPALAPEASAVAPEASAASPSAPPLAPPSLDAGGPADALLTASRTQLGRGESTTVSLIGRRLRSLTALEINAVFDPTSAQVLGVVPGGLMTLGGRTVEASVTQPEPGRVRALFTAPAGAQVPGSGSGVVAVFTVRVVKEGVTSFRVESLRAAAPDAGPGDSIQPPPALALTVTPSRVTPGVP